MSKSSNAFRLPAEWEFHHSVWIAWPCREASWSLGITRADKAFAEVANILANYETVNILVAPARFDDALEKLNSENINLWPTPLDDSWSRDTMPLFAVGDGLHLVNWRFNAWGEKFSPYANDAALCDWLAPKMARLHEDLTMDQVDWVLEGGSIHTDGQGTLLTTEECLLHPNRNGNVSKQQVEAKLKQHLNIQKVIWLPYGLAHDIDTDGHIDNVACFSRPGRVLLHTTTDTTDPNYERCQANLKALAGATDAEGREIQVVEVPLPKPIQVNGQDLATSYLNFYIANEAILMPKFADPVRDKTAAALIKREFTNRKLHQIDARAIVAGGGGIHSITMQEPRL